MGDEEVLPNNVPVKKVSRRRKASGGVICFFYFIYFFLMFLLFRAKPAAYGTSQAGVKLELQLLAYTKGTATPDL